MSAVDPNGSPVLVVGGGGGGASLPTADVSDLLAGATGSRLVATDPSGNSVLVTGPQAATLSRTIDPMTGTGWTSLTPAFGTTTTWASGKLTLTIPAVSAVSGASGIEDSDFVPDSTCVDVCARIDFVSGDGESYTNFVFALGSSISDCIMWVNTGGGNYYVGRWVGGVWTTVASSAPSGILSGDRTGGQLWLRASRAPTGVVFFYGVGSSGALPTRWTIVRTITNEAAIAAALGQYVRLGIDTSSGIAGGFTLDVLAIRASPAGAPL